MGYIGNTQGVKARPTPRAKNRAKVRARLSLSISLCAKSNCSLCEDDEVDAPFDSAVASAFTALLLHATPMLLTYDYEYKYDCEYDD